MARAADRPTIHQDLTAAHRWLLDWGVEHGPELSRDLHYYDAEVAGLWAWGASCWIGHGWCLQGKQYDRRPAAQATGGGNGIQAQRCTVPNQIPHASETLQGVNSKRQADGPPLNGSRLIPWFEALQDRLARVVVLCRDWRSGVTESVLQDTKSLRGKNIISVFLDPPYLQERRKGNLYANDGEQAALDSWEWAKQHGDRYRIGYACLVGDFEVPSGWWVSRRKMHGYQRGSRRTDAADDQVIFSPACQRQGELF